MIEKKSILENSVQFIKSVGPKRAETFKSIGIETIRDLILYFPSKYLDRRTTVNSAKAIKLVMEGYDGEVTVIGKVFDKDKRRIGSKELVKITFKDEGGFFECVWFQGGKYFYPLFNQGETFAISSRPALSKYGELQFTHPDFDKITDDESQSFISTGKIIPFYKIPKELKTKNIGELSLRKIISSAVENYSEHLTESLPEKIINKHNLMPIKKAIKEIHSPSDTKIVDEALSRFKFEELFYLETIIALRKYNYKTKLEGHSLTVNTKLVGDFLKTLPFELTQSQLNVLSEIRKDMSNKEPMNRLLQGDVGSGKTIVALISMLIAIDNGYQTVIMAPTEILADQHAKNISKLLENFSNQFPQYKIQISLLLGGQKKKEREKNLQNIIENKSSIIIGTHALFEEEVLFKNLGLVVIDEQHRFGVMQRAKLISKGITPDVIVMSATPIPRTLSMTVYGDLDISIINEMPKNRIPIKTILRGESKLPEIYNFIKEKVKENYQAFIVYPLVEESEKLDLKAAEESFKLLTEEFFIKEKVALIHGRLKWQEKEEIMLRFAAKEYDILVSTTVIEVGIDIPDANIIIINDAHRFGLSQLHQLRGRVGRSNKQAYCILVTKDEYAARSNVIKKDVEFLSSTQIEKYKSSVRLQTMIKHIDGFKIAEVDLLLRGPGDIFGTKQSGYPELKYSDLTKDFEILYNAKKEAFDLIENDPHLKFSENKIVREQLVLHYRNNLNFAKIA